MALELAGFQIVWCYLGLTQEGYQFICQVGEVGWERILRIFEIWYHIVSCGIFGGREIIEFLSNQSFLGTSS